MTRGEGIERIPQTPCDQPYPARQTTALDTLDALNPRQCGLKGSYTFRCARFEFLRNPGPKCFLKPEAGKALLR